MSIARRSSVAAVSAALAGVLLAPGIASSIARAAARDDVPASQPSLDAAVLSIERQRLMKHVETLASDDFEGRGAGTDGGRMAATYMERAFKELKLAPKGSKEFRQAFDRGSKKMANVIGLLEGSDEKLKKEFVVLGAHFDHLGAVGKKIFHGADDNASGSASLIEIARAFTLAPRPKRSILFIAFDGEESGLLGSKYFVKKPTVDIDAIVAMVNLDMVSRGVTEELRVCGAQHSPELKPDLEPLATAEKVKLFYDHETDPEWTRGSDHASFGDAGIPILYFGVLDHEDYHKPTDTADKCDAEKIERIARFTCRVVERLANQDGRPKFTKG